MSVSSIGMVELTSIAKGFLAADAMLKAARVELLMNRTICPGKYLVAVSGEVAAVEAAVGAGVAVAGPTVVDQLVIPHIDERILPAISGANTPESRGALGIIETFSVASCVEAADAALKAADVDLIQLHLAMAIGGKAYVTLTGEVAAVETATQAGIDHIKAKGLLVQRVVIPQPREEILLDRI